MAELNTVYDLLQSPEFMRCSPTQTRDFMIEQLSKVIDILYFYEMNGNDIAREVEKQIERHRESKMNGNK